MDGARPAIVRPCDRPWSTSASQVAVSSSLVYPAQVDLAGQHHRRCVHREHDERGGGAGPRTEYPAQLPGVEAAVLPAIERQQEPTEAEGERGRHGQARRRGGARAEVHRDDDQCQPARDANPARQWSCRKPLDERAGAEGDQGEQEREREPAGDHACPCGCPLELLGQRASLVGLNVLGSRTWSSSRSTDSSRPNHR